MLRMTWTPAGHTAAGQCLQAQSKRAVKLCQLFRQDLLSSCATAWHCQSAAPRQGPDTRRTPQQRGSGVACSCSVFFPGCSLPAANVSAVAAPPAGACELSGGPWQRGQCRLKCCAPAHSDQWRYAQSRHLFRQPACGEHRSRAQILLCVLCRTRTVHKVRQSGRC